MRAVPEGLAVRLASGVTTLCRCWLVERADGVVMGFTDHDRDLTVDGVVCEAASGLDAGALEASTGLSVDMQSVTGALTSDGITVADVDKGLYDGARVRLMLVDWTEPRIAMVLSEGRIGEIRRAGASFEAEVVSLSEALNQPIGRAFLKTCPLRLGEARCGVDLGLPAIRGEGTVSAAGARAFRAGGLGAFSEGWFDGGVLTWLTGDNAGLRAAVRRHARRGEETEIELWLSPAAAVAVGDAFAVTAGCDKTFATCRAKFGNAGNFRGFPHMPGDDWAAGYPQEGGAHDGGSLYRG
jgi:uncharacterized phage protein (TIGR02218 family)